MSQDRKVIRYDRKFQLGVLSLMLKDALFCSKCCELLEAYQFGDRLSWFFTQIKTSLMEKGEPSPSREYFSAQISYFNSGKAKDGIEKMIEYTKDLDEILIFEPDEDTIKKEMTTFVRANIFCDFTNSSADLFNQNRKEDAYRLVEQSLQKLHDASFENTKFVEFGDLKDVLNKAGEQVKNAIKTGIKGIDDQIVGLLPGTFTVFLGASNSGKSMLSPILALQAANQGKKTLVTIHEDEEIPTKLRFLACFSFVSLNKLVHTPQLLTEDELVRLEGGDKLLREFVTLRFMYTKDATIERVMEVARNRMREKPYDLLICDYGQCLTTEQRGLNEVRHLHEHIYHMLKQLCLELNIPGVGGAQVNRSGMAMNRSGADFLRTTDVSEAFGIIKKATNVITINRSTEDIQTNRITFLLDKARNGMCPTAVSMVSRFDQGTAYDPSEPQRIVDIKDGPAAKDTDAEVESRSKMKVVENKDGTFMTS